MIYIRNFNKEQYDYAEKVNLVEFLKRRGYFLISVGSEYTLKEHDSIRISTNKWYWHSKGKGGSPIQFLMEYEKLDLVSAILELCENNKITKNMYKESTRKLSKELPKEVNKKKIELPEKNDNNKRLFAYLTQTRCIDSEIISKLVKENLIYEDKNHNVIFVGKDNKDEIKYATKRGTSTYKKYQGEVKNSDKKYGFNIKSSVNSNKLYLFESPIDLISHMNLTKIMTSVDYKKQNRLSLGGVSDRALENYLLDNKHIREIIVCLDNDLAGWEGGEKIYNKYKDSYKVDVRLAEFGKDYNDFLVKVKQDKSYKKTIEATIKKSKQRSENYEKLGVNFKNVNSEIIR